MNGHHWRFDLHRDAVYTIMRNIVGGVFEPRRGSARIPRDLEAAVLRGMSRCLRPFARVRDFGLALVPFMSAQGAAMESPLHGTRGRNAHAPSLLCRPAGAHGPAYPRDRTCEQPVPAPPRFPHDQPTPWQAYRPTRPTASEVFEPDKQRPRPRRVVSGRRVVTLLRVAVWALVGQRFPNANDHRPPRASSQARLRRPRRRACAAIPELSLLSQLPPAPLETDHSQDRQTKRSWRAI